ncbi:L,D-transpeptidase [Chitinilyticum litopenaei]|uniref:L,D-transpeptidase n=1 Tax=Chitinilyticum litopenaei TaxID=1121276 RepID=UPI0009DBAC6D|nr:L,D-transpeptidase [Chitinilyticum litopenaei]
MGKVNKLIKVSLASQTVEAYEDRFVKYKFDCVTGDGDHPTDKGVFKILRKQHPYRSRTYNVQMDYALFFTSDGLCCTTPRT